MRPSDWAQRRARPQGTARRKPLERSQADGGCRRLGPGRDSERAADPLTCTCDSGAKSALMPEDDVAVTLATRRAEREGGREGSGPGTMPATLGPQRSAEILAARRPQPRLPQRPRRPRRPPQLPSREHFPPSTHSSVSCERLSPVVGLMWLSVKRLAHDACGPPTPTWRTLWSGPRLTARPLQPRSPQPGELAWWPRWHRGKGRAVPRHRHGPCHCPHVHGHGCSSTSLRPESHSRLSPPPARLNFSATRSHFRHALFPARRECCLF